MCKNLLISVPTYLDLFIDTIQITNVRELVYGLLLNCDMYLPIIVAVNTNKKLWYHETNIEKLHTIFETTCHNQLNRTITVY